MTIPTRIHYGDSGTIHKTTHLHVEVDDEGNVASVWFRCQPLPFEQVQVTPTRAEEMKRMREAGASVELVAVDLVQHYAGDQDTDRPDPLPQDPLQLKGGRS